MPSPDAAPTGLTPPAYLRTEETAGAGPRRSAEGEDGRRRRLEYPPAPEPLPSPVVDNHTHLDFRDGLVEVSLGDALDAAQAVGVEAVIQVGCDVPSSRWAVQAAEQDARVLAAVALHPNDAARAAARGTLDEELAAIEALAAHPRVRAIGETGLDYFRTTPDGHAAQQYSFREHVRMAAEHSLAVQIHDRDAHADVMRVLEEERFEGDVVFHCFSGDVPMARIAAERGWYLSFGGTATFKNNDELREALRLTPRERLLVETDAPFLTAVPYRGRPNAPYLVPLAVRAVAQLRQEDLEGLCVALRENTARVYGSF
ncbi:MAG: TatD family hydrolase [Arthrobacter sp.]|jgi:TatD DNase family protein|nr:TatD family hydrolase [Arthrobacter sp.]